MRHEFSEPTKTILAKRVGYRCSICGVATSGPHSNESKNINLGVAAHISAAAPGGPRYDILMTSEQRKSLSNGIWLDQKCARLIDSDPIRYSVPVLQQLKKRAEQAALAELDRSLPVNEFASLVFKDPSDLWGDSIEVKGGKNAVLRFMVELRHNVENAVQPPFTISFEGLTALRQRAHELEYAEQDGTTVEEYLRVQKRIMVYLAGEKQLRFVFDVFLIVLESLRITDDRDRANAAWNVIERFRGITPWPEMGMWFDVFRLREPTIGIRVKLRRDDEVPALEVATGVPNYLYLTAFRGSARVWDLPRQVIVQQAAPLIAWEVVLFLESLDAEERSKLEFQELADCMHWFVGPA